MGLKDGPTGYMNILEKVEPKLKLPFATHLAESRWQSCDCETCQRKRAMLDAMPGKKFDWERYRRTSDWRYDAIFYLPD